MKVNIGPYTNWVGPYQVADWLKVFGVSDDKCHSIGGKLADTWVGTFLTWVHSKKKRKVNIKIDSYDVWSMDSTLTLIILPMLIQLQKVKHGGPWVDDEDVPVEIRSSSAPPKENEWDTDEFFFKRWEWVMNELIWTFTQLQPDADWESAYFTHSPKIKSDTAETFLNGTTFTDPEGFKKHSDRISAGLRLFGKYFQALWD